MLTPQFRVQSSPSKSKGGSDKKTPAHVFFYQLTENLEICLDGRTYGNDARFCRRSHNPNAELRHVVDKGSLHLFIVAVKTLEKNNEILLPLEMQGATTSQQQPLPSINADLREINKKPVNGLVNSSSGDEMPKEKKKKKKEKVKKVSSKEKQAKSKAKKQTSGEEDEDSYHSENEVNGEAEVNNPVSPTKTKPSPGKMGLPDNSGLIVGVNTINYDAASSVRNKGKVRTFFLSVRMWYYTETFVQGTYRLTNLTIVPCQKNKLFLPFFRNDLGRSKQTNKMWEKRSLPFFRQRP